jgi:Domain of unknown function (DUF4296)
MLKKFTPYFLVFMLVVSCYNLKEPEKPKNLISKTDMVNILIDLQLGASITAPEDLKILDTNNVQLEKYIYNKYHIDSTQFALSNNYYAFFIDDYEEIYNKVKDSLEVLSDFYEKLELKEIEEARDTVSLKSTERDPSNGMIKPVSDTDIQP